MSAPSSATRPVPGPLPAPRAAFPAPTPGQPSGPARIITRPGGQTGVGGRLERMATPRLLVLLLSLCLATLAIFAIGVSSGLIGSVGAMTRASHNVQQLVRVENMKSSLLRADALATGAFLVAGQESQESRAEYDAALADASRVLAEAATAQSADTDALAHVGEGLVSYAGLMEQARATNRQGLPVGAAYLNRASTLLRTDVLPTLDALAAANTQRIEDETGSTRLWVVLLALLPLAAMIWTTRQLARRFRRRFNVGIALGASLVLLSAAIGGGAIAWSASSADVIGADSLARARALSTIRTAAFDGQALESLTLISRGSGQAYEEAWKADDAVVRESLAVVDSAQLDASWQIVATAHRTVRSQDDAGRWDAAVKSSTTTSVAALDRFQALVQPALDQAVTDSTSSLLRLRWWLWIALVLGVVGSIAAATATVWGLQQRRREYE